MDWGCCCAAAAMCARQADRQHLSWGLESVLRGFPKIQTAYALYASPAGGYLLCLQLCGLGFHPQCAQGSTQVLHLGLLLLVALLELLHRGLQLPCLPHS